MCCRTVYLQHRSLKENQKKRGGWESSQMWAWCLLLTVLVSRILTKPGWRCVMAKQPVWNRYTITVPLTRHSGISLLKRKDPTQHPCSCEIVDQHYVSKNHPPKIKTNKKKKSPLGYLPWHICAATSTLFSSQIRSPHSCCAFYTPFVFTWLAK